MAFTTKMKNPSKECPPLLSHKLELFFQFRKFYALRIKKDKIVTLIK